MERSFRDGETLRISDMDDEDDATGHEEFIVISGTPTILGDVVTITLATPLANDYSDTDTYVAACIDIGDMVASADAAVVTSASGTFDDGEVTAHNIGCIEEEVTFTFTSATAFNAAGAVSGSLGSGNVSTPFAPTNSDFASAFFTIAAAAWGGTFATSDTVVIDFHPASTGIWEKRVTPAGTASFATSARLHGITCTAA
jgi:hypothetical protein